MIRTAVAMLSVQAVFAADSHGHEKELCSCAQHEADHPFKINCADGAKIRAATVLLETTCEAGAQAGYEWGGSFSTPANAYKWVAQAVDGAYADPAMNLAIFSTDNTDKEHLLEQAAAAKALLAGTCPELPTGGSIAKPTSAGACYKLKFPAPATDYVATVDTTGVANVTFFAEHVPTEFERDKHYFLSTDEATDIEPVVETDAKEYMCKLDKNSAGVKECAQAFYTIQAHHDYCDHDTLTRYEEELFHEWESKCVGCSIVRKYDPDLKKCPIIDCDDTTVAELGYEHLKATCVAADFEYPFEWAGSFDTPLNSYTWVSQAATDNATFTSGKTYADEKMKIAVFSMTSTPKSVLFGMKATADTVMSGTCTPVTATCTPADTSCASMPTMVPTVAGNCYEVTFPDSTTTLTDFMAKVDTTGVAHVAFFTAHMPTEFERDTHYFMSTDLATDIEPDAQLGASGGHDHGRRLSTGRDDIRTPKRKLANAGTCCTSTQQQGAWKQVVSYHDLCDHDKVPSYIEVGFHDYEESCENFFCNLVDATVDQETCPPPPVTPSTGIPVAAVGGIAGGCGAVVLLAVVGLYCMYSKEKAGKPIFTPVVGAKAAA